MDRKNDRDSEREREREPDRSGQSKCDRINVLVDLYKWVSIVGSRPEWCISSMIYSGDTPFWSRTLSIQSVMTLPFRYEKCP